MEAKDLILFGLLGLGAIYIAKAGFKPKVVSVSGDGGFRVIPILPSFTEIGKPKEPEAPAPAPAPATHITYNVEVPEPSPIVFPPTPEPTPEPTPTPKPKKVYYQGRTGTWTYEPETKILISPQGWGWSTEYPEEQIKSVEEAQKYPISKKKKKEYITYEGVKIPKEEFLKRPEWFGGEKAKKFAEQLKKIESFLNPPNPFENIFR